MVGKRSKTSLGRKHGKWTYMFPINGVLVRVLAVAAACNPTVPTERGIAGPGGRETSGVLAFLVQPTDTRAGAPIAPSVKVAPEDTLSRVLTSFSGNVTVAIGTNPAQGTLRGTTTVSVSGGVAIFDSLRIDKPGVGYTLTVTATGLRSSTSSPFNIR